MDPTTEIASKFTVAQYQAVRPELDPTTPGPAWSETVTVFRRRVEERFLAPIAKLLEPGRSGSSVPGFAILALDCLLIDTLQSFREGRVSTGEVSPAQSFKRFLKSQRFAGFNSDDRDEFFNYVRNGLLHNGETRGDWKVRADTSQMLTKAASGARTINRTKFHQAIVEEFEDYCGELTTGSVDVRERFRSRMDAICGIPGRPGSYYFAYGSNLADNEIRMTAPGADAEGVAYVPGWRLVFNKHSSSRGGDAASIEKCPTRLLWGFVYRVSADEKKRITDREGGYVEQRLKPLLVDDPGTLERCTPIDAFTFIGKSECPRRCGPADSYLKLVVEGARQRGLPPEHIATLEAKCR